MQKDYFHDMVVRVLQNDGWTITKEQDLHKIGTRRIWIDLAASKVHDGVFIFVEVKSFDITRSQVEYLSSALGQYLMYRAVLDYLGKAATLYLAAPAAAYVGILNETIGKVVVNTYDIKLLIFDPETEEVKVWRT